VLSSFIFLDPEGRSQKATVVVLQFSKRPKTPEGFLNTVTQRSTTKLCVHIRADIAHRSTV